MGSKEKPALCSTHATPALLPFSLIFSLPFSTFAPLCTAHYPIIHIVFASRQGEASSAAPELPDFYVMWLGKPKSGGACLVRVWQQWQWAGTVAWLLAGRAHNNISH